MPLPDDTNAVFIVAACCTFLAAAVEREVFMGVGHKFMALAPWPSEGPAHSEAESISGFS